MTKILNQSAIFLIKMLNHSANFLNATGAAWCFLLALIILTDVVGRSFFNAPLQGTKEIVSNSIVAIVFLQFPLAVRDGDFLRTTLIYDKLPTVGRKIIDSLGYLIGASFFIAMAVGGWPDMVVGWNIREFEGEGAMRVPVYPIRTIVVAMCWACASGFLLLTAATLLGRTGSENKS